MLKNCMMGALFAFAFSAPVQAAVQSYSFEATIDSVAIYSAPYTFHSLSSIDGPFGGAKIEVGQTIRGQFSFDTDSGSDTLHYPGHALQYYSKPTAYLTYTILPTNTTFSMAATAIGTDYESPSTGDTFGFWGDSPSTSIWFEGLSKTALANGFPTKTLSMDTLSNASFNAGWRNDDPAWAHLGDLLVSDYRGRITAVTLLPVPEADTWLMLSLGLAAVAIARRSQRG